MSEVGTELAVLLDVGSAWAKATVIGRARGRWRVVTRVAQPTAWGSGELHEALVQRLGSAIDSRLAPRAAELLGGANRIECHTARRPGRLAVVAVSRELSGSAARRAAESAGWQVLDVVTLDDGRSLADRLAILQALEVDAWLVTGGFDGARSPRVLEAAGLVAAARRRGTGPVVWAGDAALADEVEGLFEGDAVRHVANVRPEPRGENPDALRDELQRMLRSVVAREDERHLVPIALPRAAGALARVSGLRTLVVDVGARGALAALADPDGTVTARVRGAGGLSGVALLAGAASRISRLAGDAGDEGAVADVLQTLRARPATLPELAEELAVAQVAARLQAASLVEELAPGTVDVVIGCGGPIAGATRPAEAARVLLDSVRPLGVTQLAVDTAFLLGPLGTLPDDEIREGIALLAEDLVIPLATSVVCRGGEPGRVAMRVTVHRAGWPAGAPVEVRAGQLQVLPLSRGQEAELTIELGDGVSLGSGRRSPRVQAAATGGAVGLILDARGVPMALPRRGDDRRAVLAAWWQALSREAPVGMEHAA